MGCGALRLGWLLRRQSEIASAALDNGAEGKDKAFYEGKVAVASFFAKNILPNDEHALIMYLHGRALEGSPAKLYYAFPAEQALTAVAKPYWFDAAGETRTVTRDVTTLPGHKVVEVAFTEIGAAG